jgi:hypothetical protein
MYLCGFFMLSPINDDSGSEIDNIIKEQAIPDLYSQKKVEMKINAKGKNIVPSVFLFKS